MQLKRWRANENYIPPVAADSDDEDKNTTYNTGLPFCHAGKKQLQRSEKITSFTPAVVFGNQPMLAAVDNNRNKRKTPSPVFGEEPAAVSVAHSNEEGMDTEETHHTLETCDSTEAGYDSDNNMLPSPGRRVSLSPVSRRLAIQFDSISFFSPVKPSRAKRRKTLDTSASL